MSVNVYVWRKLGGSKSLISPDEFLKWAKQDIRGGGRRSIANALTNTKRAIHARIDEILYALRIQYTNNWPDIPKTEDKLKAVERLEIQTTSIVKILTSRRNDLEHRYLLPSLEQVRADVETAEMWLDRSESYLRPSVVLIGLSVKSIDSGASAVTRRNTFNATFAEPHKVEFYWDAKKEIVTLSKTGTTSRNNYGDLNWKEMIRRQKKLYLSNSNSLVFPVSVATKLYQAYKKWVLGNRGSSSFTASKKFS